MTLCARGPSAWEGRCGNSPARCWMRQPARFALPQSRTWYFLVLVLILDASSPARAQQVFEPWSSPQLIDPNVEEIPIEDRPVKKRRPPEYEAAGLRVGSWLLEPSLTAGGFYDSNVFSSNTVKRSDIVGLFEPTLRAKTLWENHALSFE